MALLKILARNAEVLARKPLINKNHFWPLSRSSLFFDKNLLRFRSLANARSPSVSRCIASASLRAGFAMKHALALIVIIQKKTKN